MELREYGNCRLFPVNGKWKWQTSVHLQQTETENESWFSLVRKDE